MIEFFVPGNPQAQQRHRSFQKGKFRGNYDPSAGDKADFLAKCMQHKPENPLTGAIYLKIVAVFPRPASHFKGNRSKGLRELKPDVSSCYTRRRNDWDNIGKFVSDALNGIFYEDDGQISLAMVTRCYIQNSYPQIGIAIKLEEIEK